jgi:hypothetical protein
VNVSESLAPPLGTNSSFEPVPNLAVMKKDGMNHRAGIGCKEECEFESISSGSVQRLHFTFVSNMEIIKGLAKYRICLVFLQIEIATSVDHFLRIVSLSISIVEFIRVEWQMTAVPGICQVQWKLK